MVIVDTTVWVDYFNGVRNPETDWLDNHVESEFVGLTDIILCEVLQGFRDEARFEKAREHLLRFSIFAGNSDLAIASALNYRTLRRQGITIRKTMDCLIATSCLLGGHSLLHNDRDFDPFEEHLGLSVLHAGLQP